MPKLLNDGSTKHLLSRHARAPSTSVDSPLLDPIHLHQLHKPLHFIEDFADCPKFLAVRVLNRALVKEAFDGVLSYASEDPYGGVFLGDQHLPRSKIGEKDASDFSSPSGFMRVIDFPDGN